MTLRNAFVHSLTTTCDERSIIPPRFSWRTAFCVLCILLLIVVSRLWTDDCMNIVRIITYIRKVIQKVSCYFMKMSRKVFFWISEKTSKVVFRPKRNLAYKRTTKERSKTSSEWNWIRWIRYIRSIEIM